MDTSIIEYFMWRGRVSVEDILVGKILLLSSFWARAPE
jgi:hypothetical protein